MQRLIINTCQKTKKVMRRILFAFICFLLITGCEKNQEVTNCKELQTAFFNNDQTKIQQAVTEAINRLRSKTHTQENLTALAARLTNECGITAKILCFSCIKTLPAQSELRLSVTDGTRIVNKTIDISAISISNETMRFVAMHD